MAVRRVIPLIAAKMSQNPFRREASRKFHPSPNSFSRSYEHYIRGFQSVAEATFRPLENKVKPEPHSSISNPTWISNLKASDKEDHAVIFTCKVCNARSFRIVCRESYKKGLVVARCDGCSNLHLVADRLGLFGEPGSVEEFLAARGEKVEKGSGDTYNVTLEDLCNDPLHILIIHNDFVKYYYYRLLSL